MKTVNEFANKQAVQELPYTSAQQSFLEAKCREEEREQKQNVSDAPYSVVGIDPNEMKDWRRLRRYEENFGPRAEGSSTLCRGDVIEPK